MSTENDIYDAIGQTESLLGTPLLSQALVREKTPAVLTRWQYGSAAGEVSPAGCIRVVVSLSGGNRAHGTGSNRITRRVSAGSVAIVPSGTLSAIASSVPGDSLQLFLAEVAHSPAKPRTLRFDFNDPDANFLRTEMLQLWQATTSGAANQRQLVETHLQQLQRRIQQTLDRDQAHPKRVSQEVRLAPSTRRRIDQLLDRALERESTESASLTLQSLADVANLSVNHLIRSFRHDTGLTPHQYILRRRVDKAVELLRNPHQSIAATADATGFCSPAYFSASVRQALGITPASLRRMLAGR